MDDADRAKIFEQDHREHSLHEVLDRTNPEQLVIGGVVCCLDCKDPIPVERLIAKPDAARCIECKEFFEKYKK